MVMSLDDLIKSTLLTGTIQEAQKPPETAGEQFDVYGKNAPISAPAPTINPADLIPRSLDNRDFITQRDQDLNNANAVAEHKGMFGIKGTLRNVLGLLGDSLLVGSGRASEYDKVRQREREGDAMAGFSQDPAGAAERLTAVNPTAARAIQTLAINDQIKKQQLASMDAARQQEAATKQFQVYTNTAKLLSNIFASPVAKTNPDLAFRQAKFIAGRANIPLEEFGLHEGMTPDEINLLASQGMTPNQTAQLPYRERMTSVAEQNADANTTRANRPPAGRAPPNPTAASLAAPILQKLKNGGTLTAGEREFLDRSGFDLPKTKTKTTPRPAGVATPAPPPGFRLGRKITNNP